MNYITDYGAYTTNCSSMTIIVSGMQECLCTGTVSGKLC